MTVCRVAQYDLCILADGQWSRTRTAVFGKEAVTIVPKGLYLAYCTIPKTDADNGLWNWYNATESRVLHTRPDPYSEFSHLDAEVSR